MGRNKNTRIINKFEFWSVADCDCSLCLHHVGKDHPCPLDVCCIEDIRQEAVRREQNATEVAANNCGVSVADGKEVALSAVD